MEFTNEQIKQLISVFSRQSFFDWYCDGGEFDAWTRGEKEFENLTEGQRNDKIEESLKNLIK